MKKFSKKFLNGLIPCSEWLGRYKLPSDLISDFIAGTTSGLMVIPMSLAFATLAGLDPKYGLYSSFVGCFIYIIFGTCPQMAIGPVSLLSIMIYQTCQDDNPNCVILVGFYAGVFELLLAILQLGFKAGAVLTVLSSQFKNLMGIPGSKGQGIVQNWEKIIQDFEKFHKADAIVGLTSFVILVFFLNIYKIFNPKSAKFQKILKITSNCGNILVILSSSALAYFIWGQNPPFKLTGNVQGGFPPVKIPSFILAKNHSNSDGDFQNPDFGNPEEFYTFWTTWSEVLRMGPMVIGLLAILQNVSVFKAFSKYNEENPLTSGGIRASQEMVALGLCNVAGSFFSAIPVTGSISRSAAVQTSGVRTPLAGLFSGSIVILALLYFASTFYYIPKSSLAAVIFSANFTMLEIGEMVKIWKISKKDFFCMAFTFISSVYLGIEYGIIAGALLSLLLKVKSSSEKKSSKFISRFKSIRSDGTGEILLFLELEPIHLGLELPPLKHFKEEINQAFQVLDSGSGVLRSRCSGILLNFTSGAGLNNLECGYSAVMAILNLKRCIESDFGLKMTFYGPSSGWSRGLEACGLNLDLDMTGSQIRSTNYLEDDVSLILA